MYDAMKYVFAIWERTYDPMIVIVMDAFFPLILVTNTLFANKWNFGVHSFLSSFATLINFPETSMQRIRKWKIAISFIQTPENSKLYA